MITYKSAYICLLDPVMWMFYIFVRGREQRSDETINHDKHEKLHHDDREQRLQNIAKNKQVVY